MNKRRTAIGLSLVGAALVAFFAARREGSEPGYRPNDEVRSRFANLDLEEIDRATVNGDVLSFGETMDLIAALRLSQRRMSGLDGRPYRSDDHEDGTVEVSRKYYLKGDHHLVFRFALRGPSRHHGRPSLAPSPHR